MERESDINKHSGTIEQVNAQVRKRLFRALNYLTIYVFVIIVYGGALLTDYVLFELIAWLLADDVKEYALVAQWFDYARMGLALLLVVCAVTHGIISTVSQIRLDIALAKEGQEK